MLAIPQKSPRQRARSLPVPTHYKKNDQSLTTQTLPQATAALGQAYRLYSQAKDPLLHKALIFDHALMKQLIVDGRRGIRPERLKTIAQDIAW